VDRVPRIAIPVNIVAALAAGAAHIALQSATASALWVRSMPSQDEASAVLAAFGARWLVAFPSQLYQLVDWELLAAMGILALAHAVFYRREAQQRALREAQLEARLMEAQLLALQQQLQPHFLFNTLHAISALMHRDVNLADKVLVRLSDLLRITLELGGQKEARLSRELDVVQSYLEIEKARLGDRLTVAYDIDATCLDCLVPVLILQPLVENAVKHGIARHTAPGRVEISARSTGEWLVLTVTNAGPDLTESAPHAGAGIGHANTRARLLHHFGDDGRLDLEPEPHRYTARVTFPCRK
jgi:LytS/YehU family sensor histidine kinase